MAASIELPEGFVLDAPQGLPEGFVLDQPKSNPYLTAAKGILGFNQAVSDFGAGEIAGLKNTFTGIGQLGSDIIGSFFPENQTNLAAREILAEQARRTQAQLQQETKGSLAGRTGQFVGNVAPYMLIPGAAETLPAKMALQGAGSGFAAATQPETKDMEPGKALGQRAAQGTVGTVFGALLPPVTEAVPAIAKTGVALVAGRDADKILASRLQGKDLRALRDELRQSGTTTILPDIAGDEVKGLTRAVGAMTGGAKDIVSNSLNNRSEAAVRRVSRELSRNVSNIDTYFGNLEDIANARAAIASPLYNKAYKANQNVMTPEIRRILDTPAGQKALKDAAVKMQNDMTLLGVPDKELAEQAKLVGVYQPGGISSGFKLRTLDYVKRALDDQVGVAVRAGETDNARVLTGLKNRFIASLDNADVTAKAGPNSLKPEGGAYAQARKIFSDSYSLEAAQEEGLKFASRDPEQIAKFLKDLTPGEKEAYRIGVRKSLQDTVNKTPDGADPAKRIFGNTQRRLQLEAVFGTGKNLQKFSRRMREEIAAADTKFKVLGGSRTDINLADDMQFIGEAMRIAQSQGKTQQLTNAVTTAIYNRAVGITRKNARELANILTSRKQGIRALDRLISEQSDPVQKQLITQIKNETSAFSGVAAGQYIGGE